jgi:cell division protein FtsL
MEEYKMKSPKAAAKDELEEKTDWNEEFDAWLELIEDHLKSMSRTMTFLLVLMILVALSNIILAYIFLRLFISQSSF